MGTRNVNCILLKPVDTTEVSKILKEMKESSPGWDEIQAKIVKKTFISFIAPLTHICNLSILKGCFPSELKLAKVVPIFKADCRSTYTNYRPVSVLSCFSKLLETLMYDRLISFIIQHELLYKYQFGFRKAHSTILAILTLTDMVSKALENGNHVIGVFLDFSKAFDTVDHDILFHKLDHLGIRGTALDWLRDYLTSRHQFVMYDKISSDKKVVTCGVPQGSVLGPLLFLLYVNDIANISDTLFSILFADDTNALAIGKDLNVLIETVNKELQKVVTWLAANKLSLNIKKTHFMIFRTKNKNTKHSNPIKIGNEIINEVEHTKFLGVIIDNRLKWNFHVNLIKRKISKGFGVICKAKRLMKKETLVTLYYSFVYPYLQYGIIAWGSTYDNVINPIFRLQKKIVRVISSSRWHAPSDPIFKSLKLLPLYKIYILNVMMFMYKIHFEMFPNIFGDMFVQNSEIHGYDTRQSNNYHVQIWHLELVRRSIRIQGVHFWNLIQNQINCYVTLVTFKYHVKKFLLENDFNDN